MNVLKELTLLEELFLFTTLREPCQNVTEVLRMFPVSWIEAQTFGPSCIHCIYCLNSLTVVFKWWPEHVLLDRKLWSVGSAHRYRLGTQKHQEFWWQSRQHHHLWRVSRGSQRQLPGSAWKIFFYLHAYVLHFNDWVFVCCYGCRVSMFSVI